jgi:hypothetical protein
MVCSVCKSALKVHLRRWLKEIGSGVYAKEYFKSTYYMRVCE